MHKLIENIIKDNDFPEGENWQKIDFSANDIILEAGTHNQELYLVEKGQVSILSKVNLEGGGNIHPGVADLTENDVFGEMSLFSDELCNTTVKAVSDCCLIKIDGKALLDFLEKHPVIGFHLYEKILKVLTSRLRKTNQQFGNVMAWGIKAHGLNKELS